MLHTKKCVKRYDRGKANALTRINGLIYRPRKVGHLHTTDTGHGPY